MPSCPIGAAGKILPLHWGQVILGSGIPQEVPFRWNPLMRLVTLFLIAAFAASTVDGGSYQKTYGTIVDPIMNWWHDKPTSTGQTWNPMRT